jgi:hypothetical protein
MIMQRVVSLVPIRARFAAPLALAMLLGGCATGYSYHQGDGGDYYSGNPHVEYRYIGGPYPYGYWGGYYGGGPYGRYGGYGGGYYGWYAPGYWHGYGGYGGYHRYRGPYKPRVPNTTPLPSTPPPGYTPNPGPTGGSTGLYDSDDPRGIPDYDRPGRKNGNPPPPPRVVRPTVSMPRAPVLPPSQVVRPMPPAVRPATPVVRPSTPAPMPRPSVSPTVRSERAIERARARSGSGDTP